MGGVLYSLIRAVSIRMNIPTLTKPQALNPKPQNPECDCEANPLDGSCPTRPGGAGMMCFWLLGSGFRSLGVRGFRGLGV